VNVCAIRDRQAACNLNRQHSGTTNIPLTANGPGLAQRMRLSGLTSGPLAKGCPNRRTIDGAAEQTDDHPPAVRCRFLDLDGVITDTAVLKAAKLDALFEVQVDGNVIHAQQLAGKPAPDTCLITARLLGIEPARTVVVQDAQLGSPGGV
jgi:hypothetical protein